MKKLIATLLLFFIFNLGYSKVPGEKTFLVIFNKAELKAHKTSAAFIELSLMTLFQTKSYAGNSDAAILVKIPHTSIDRCQLGEFTVRVNQNKVSQLDEIAFKIYDMDESKEAYQQLISTFDSKKKNQKSEKNAKPIPAS